MMKALWLSSCVWPLAALAELSGVVELIELAGDWLLQDSDPSLSGEGLRL